MSCIYICRGRIPGSRVHWVRDGVPCLQHATESANRPLSKISCVPTSWTAVKTGFASYSTIKASPFVSLTVSSPRGSRQAGKSESQAHLNAAPFPRSMIESVQNFPLRALCKLQRPLRLQRRGSASSHSVVTMAESSTYIEYLLCRTDTGGTSTYLGTKYPSGVTQPRRYESYVLCST